MVGGGVVPRCPIVFPPPTSVKGSEKHAFGALRDCCAIPFPQPWTLYGSRKVRHLSGEGPLVDTLVRRRGFVRMCVPYSPRNHERHPRRFFGFSACGSEALVGSGSAGAGC